MAAPKNNKNTIVKANNELQNVTNSDPKIYGLLRRKHITSEDTKSFSDYENVRLGELCSKRIRKLQGPDREKFIKKIEDIVDEGTKRGFWEYNHGRIIYAISSLMKQYGRLPSADEIARTVDLSRTSVYRHLKEYSTHPLYLEQQEKLRILSSNVLTRVYLNAMNDDLGSQKLFLNAMGYLGNGQGRQVNNNFIQVNNLLITQESILKLDPKQLAIVESTLKSVISQSEILTIDATKTDTC
jgi:predicted DNA-binding protein YlxM (UPF0122 family)